MSTDQPADGAGTPSGAGAVGVVLVAAGLGTRLGAGVPKAFVRVWGRTLLEHGLAGIRAAGLGNHVVVVAPATHLDEARALAGAQAQVVAGGAERTDSVAAGLAALGACEVVLVHDAARCLAPPAVFDRVVGAVRAGADAAVPGLPVVDTLKTVEPGADDAGAPVEVVAATPDRAGLRAVQTPQGFTRSALGAGHAHARLHGLGATDDAALVEATGGRVVLVPGDEAAAKVTTPPDVRAASDRIAARLGPALVVLGGLPGVGKSTVAAALEREVGAVRVRVDTIEAALRTSGEWPAERGGVAGYAVAVRLAAEHLGAGRLVVADTVNPVEQTREAWRDVAAETGAAIVEISLVCRDVDAHERRLSERARTGGGVPGQPEPPWESVQQRQLAPWPTARVIDTAVTTPEEAARVILDRLLDVAGWVP